MDGIKYNENAPKLKILSIDWDYFIDTVKGEREWLFPDGGSEMLPANVQASIWANRYQSYIPGTATELEAIRGGYRFLQELPLDYAEAMKLSKIVLSDGKLPIFFVAESHREMGNVFASFWNTGNYSSVKIVNIDYHSDMYDKHTEEFNCGNWLYHIINQIGKINPALQNTDNMCNEYIWVHRPDSSTDTSDDIPDAIRPYVELQEGIDIDTLADYYDVVFICKSSMWTPPHLDQIFMSAVKFIKFQHVSFEFDEAVMVDRMPEVMRLIEVNKEIYADMRRLVHGDEIEEPDI